MDHPLLSIVVPAYNEERRLPHTLPRILAFLQAQDYPGEVVVVDDGSTDSTARVVEEIAADLPYVTLIRNEHRGKGYAVNTGALAAHGDYIFLCDADLSMPIEEVTRFLPPALEGYDVAIGSRLAPGSETTRSFRRELISRAYNRLIKAMFFTRFSDAQCGFKALSRQAAHELLLHVKNEHWFLDTELLILAEKGGYRIKDIPVRWVEDPDSRVRVASTAWEDIRGLLRLRFSRLPRRPPRGV